MIAVPPGTPSDALPEAADLAVVGGGLVGLAVAFHAVRRGLGVVVLERDEAAVGASVRNFGHVCTTAQSGLIRELALAAREDWLAIGAATDVEVKTAGTVVVARSDAETAVLEEFAAERGSDEVQLLAARGVADRLRFRPPGLQGGAFLPLDLRVDAPAAVAALAGAVQEAGARVLRRTTAHGIEPGVVHTSRGDVRAERVVLAVNYDVDRFFPELADAVGLRRCLLRMLEVDAPGGVVIEPAVLTGSSLLRYGGLASQPSAARVRAQLERRSPELLAHDVNLMLTQRPDGRLVLGDTHRYELTETPFEDEDADRVLLKEFRRLLDVDTLRVRRRWRGVYASSPHTPFLVAEPLPGVTVASVTTGVGMTTGFGLARAVLDGVPLDQFRAGPPSAVAERPSDPGRRPPAGSLQKKDSTY